jgi:hypothetical protein
MYSFLKHRWNLLITSIFLCLLCIGCNLQSDNSSREDPSSWATSTPSPTNTDKSPLITETPYEIRNPETTGSQYHTPRPTATLSPKNTPTPSPTHRPPVDLELIGQFGGAIHDLEIQGSYLYIGMGLRVIVVDISNPWKPQIVGQSDIFDSVVIDIALSDNVAYVVCRDGNLFALDLSNPNAIRTVGTFQIQHEPSAIAVTDEYVFVTESECAKQNGGPCHYVGGLEIIDVHNPAHMQKAAFVEKDGGFNNVVVKDIYAYITGGKEGLTVFNISKPSKPKVIGILDEPSISGQITLAGKYAYVGNSNTSAAILDLSEPADPVVVTDFVGRCTGALAFLDDYIYNVYSRCYSMATGLDVIEAPEGLAKFENGRISIIGRIEDGFQTSNEPTIVVQEKIAYATGSLGIQVIDLRNSDNPVIINQLQIPGYIHDVAVHGSFAYVLCVDAHGPSGIYILDITQPSSINFENSFYNIQLHYVGLPQSFSSKMDIGDKFAYIAISNPEGPELSQFNILDLSQPLHPSQVWGEQMILGYDELVASEDLVYAYTSRSSTVTIYNVPDPTDPYIENHIPNVGSIEALEVKGDYAYAWITGEGFEIYDWSNPQSPQLMSEIALEGRAWSMIVEDNIAFISIGDILEIDVSDPFHPEVIHTIELPIKVRNLTTSDGHLFATTWDAGLLIFQLIK